MNIETGQASRSKHELHTEHEQNLALLSLQSRSDNALIFTSCHDNHVISQTGSANTLKDFPVELENPACSDHVLNV